MKRSTVVTLALCALLQGCAYGTLAVSTLGQAVNTKELTVTTGVTTPAEVLSVLGKPSDDNSYIDSSGKAVNLYVYSRLHAMYGLRVDICSGDTGHCVTRKNDRNAVYFMFENGRLTQAGGN